MTVIVVVIAHLPGICRHSELIIRIRCNMEVTLMIAPSQCGMQKPMRMTSALAVMECPSSVPAQKVRLNGKML